MFVPFDIRKLWKIMIQSWFVSDSVNNLRTLCNTFQFREHAPSIIFMDEIDSIGSARMESGTGNGDSEVQRTMLELLNQLDGFEASNKIKVHCTLFIKLP